MNPGESDRAFFILTDSSGNIEKKRVEVDPETLEPVDNVPREPIRKEIRRMRKGIT